MSPEEEVTLWLGATRYYMGRMSYAVSDFCDLLIEEWPDLDNRVKRLIERDLEDAIKRDDEQRTEENLWCSLGMKCDRDQWDKVRRLWRGTDG